MNILKNNIDFDREVCKFGPRSMASGRRCTGGCFGREALHGKVIREAGPAPGGLLGDLPGAVLRLCGGLIL